MEKNVHENHRQRVRRRLKEEGVDSFDDHQLLELILFYVVPRKDTNELAHKLLNEFGSLAGLFEANPDDIQKLCKVGEPTAAFLTLIPLLTRRYQISKWKEKPVLGNVSEAGNYTVSHFAGEPEEKFFIICLNTRNQVLGSGVVQRGTVDEVAVYPRKIMEIALRQKAYAIIMAHNHPGGSLVPSRNDIEITNTVVLAMESIGMKVRDHIIVAGDRYVSMKQENYF